MWPVVSLMYPPYIRCLCLLTGVTQNEWSPTTKYLPSSFSFPLPLPISSSTLSYIPKYAAHLKRVMYFPTLIKPFLRMPLFDLLVWYIGWEPLIEKYCWPCQSTKNRRSSAVLHQGETLHAGKNERASETQHSRGWFIATSSTYHWRCWAPTFKGMATRTYLLEDSGMYWASMILCLRQIAWFFTAFFLIQSSKLPLRSGTVTCPATLSLCRVSKHSMIQNIKSKGAYTTNRVSSYWLSNTVYFEICGLVTVHAHPDVVQ